MGNEASASGHHRVMRISPSPTACLELGVTSTPLPKAGNIHVVERQLRARGDSDPDLCSTGSVSRNRDRGVGTVSVSQTEPSTLNSGSAPCPHPPLNGSKISVTRDFRSPESCRSDFIPPCVSMRRTPVESSELPDMLDTHDGLSQGGGESHLGSGYFGGFPERSALSGDVVHCTGTYSIKDDTGSFDFCGGSVPDLQSAECKESYDLVSGAHIVGHRVLDDTEQKNSEASGCDACFVDSLKCSTASNISPSYKQSKHGWEQSSLSNHPELSESTLSHLDTVFGQSSIFSPSPSGPGSKALKSQLESLASLRGTDSGGFYVAPADGDDHQRQRQGSSEHRMQNTVLFHIGATSEPAMQTHHHMHSADATLDQPLQSEPSITCMAQTMFSGDPHGPAVPTNGSQTAPTFGPQATLTNGPGAIPSNKPTEGDQTQFTGASNHHQTAHQPTIELTNGDQTASQPPSPRDLSPSHTNHHCQGPTSSDHRLQTASQPPSPRDLSPSHTDLHCQGPTSSDHRLQTRSIGVLPPKQIKLPGRKVTQAEKRALRESLLPSVRGSQQSALPAGGGAQPPTPDSSHVTKEEPGMKEERRKTPKGSSRPERDNGRKQSTGTVLRRLLAGSSAPRPDAQNGKRTRPSNGINRDLLALQDINGHKQHFDAYLCVAQEDLSNFGIPFQCKLEQWGFKIFLPERDLLLGGFKFEKLSAVVEERCTGKVVVVLSKFYESSAECRFLTHFARTLDPDAQKRNIIPVTIDKNLNSVPNVLRGITQIHYNHNYKQGWLEAKLREALNS